MSKSLNEEEIQRLYGAFFENMQKQVQEKGTMTCSFPLCNCPKRQEVLPHKMHVFFRPNGEAIDACCNNALSTLIKVYSIKLEK